MRVAIVGAGAMGCKFAFRLTTYSDLVLLSRHRSQVEVIRQRGLTLIEDGHERSVPVNITDDHTEIQQPDLALLFVKAYDTQNAACLLPGMLASDGLVLTLQNGLGNREVIASVVDKQRVLQGMTFQAARMLRPDLVEDTGSRGVTYLASHSELETQIAEIAELFSSAGFPTKVIDDLDSVLWGKLLINVGLNALATLLRIPNRTFNKVKEVQDLSFRLMDEALQVAQAKGIRLPYDPKAMFVQVMEETGRMYSSTLLDAMAGKQTEVDVINGAIVREGERMGIETTLNALLVRFIKAMESSYPYRIA